MTTKDLCWLGKAVNYLSEYSKIGEGKIKLLKYLISKKKNGMLQEPIRGIVKHSGVSNMTVTRTLQELSEGGLLDIADPQSREARIYKFVY